MMLESPDGRTGLPQTDDPLGLLGQWLDDARDRSGMTNWNVLHLATVGAAGSPSVRPVLMKGVDLQSGRLTIFTNYSSRKARDIAENPRVAGLFHWDALERQIRIEAISQRSTPKVSDDYFALRDRESQLGSWASRQSEPLSDPMELLQRVVKVGLRYAGRPVPRPPFWGGFDLHLTSIEFWQGQPARLHLRVRYERQSDGAWLSTALNP